MRKFLLTAILGVLFIGKSVSQNYRVMNFAQVDSFLENQNDTLYVVNFWATWCKPCIEELPDFVKVESEMPEIRMVFISLDGQPYWNSSLAEFLKLHGIKSEVWVIEQQKPFDWIDRVDPRWQGSIPATMIFNNAQKVLIFEEHPFTYEQLVSTIQNIQQTKN